MQQQDHFFTETVDEQIEHLAHSQGNTPESLVVRDLHGLYERGDSPEQVRSSLNAIWSRLADHLSPENQTLASELETGPVRSLSRAERQRLLSPPLPSEQAGANEVGTLLAYPSRPRPDKRRWRRTLVYSVLAALLLLGIFSWTLISLLRAPASGGTASGPGTPASGTPVSSTPAPQSMRDQAHQLVGQFHQEVSAWGKDHTYNDPTDGKTYELDYAYGQQGLGGVLDHQLAQAKNTAEYQDVINQAQNALINLHAMESNATDPAPWNQPHKADNDLLSHYKLNSGTVMVVSLLEQTMRVYQNGQLVKAFKITSGRYEVPSLPGYWTIGQRQHNFTMLSSVPKGSPYWFPPMQVEYGLLYHSGGYWLVSSQWRADYGGGTNFPHKDSGGNAFANDGSMGNVDVPVSDMTWLYAHTQMNDSIILY
ncbi:MAG TPA: L,D-transpeptidase family protein [Ktedonobacteraceae bacterium]|nr:L,D-transpeptidase family protein [Ktedonobacteraceae bacterium]